MTNHEAINTRPIDLNPASSPVRAPQQELPAESILPEWALKEAGIQGPFNPESSLDPLVGVASRGLEYWKDFVKTAAERQATLANTTPTVEAAAPASPTADKVATPITTPEQTAPAEPITQRFVTSREGNIRADAVFGTNSEILGQLTEANGRIEIIEDVIGQEVQNSRVWYHIRVPQEDGSFIDGYIHSSAVAVETEQVIPDGTIVPATPASPELPSGPAVPPDTSLTNPEAPGLVSVEREFTLSELLAMPEADRPLPEYALNHPEEDEWPVLNQLPTHVFNVANGQAFPVPVQNPTIVQLSTGEYSLRVPGFEGGEILWKPESGWAVPQYETLTTRVLLDTGFAFEDNRIREHGTRKDFVFAIRPFDRNALTGSAATYMADQDYTSAYIDRYKTPTPNPLLIKENTPNINELMSPLDAQVISAFAYIEKNGNPTDADILDVWRRYSQTAEEMIVQTPEGSWNLRSGIDLVFAPTNEIKNNARTPRTQFGYRFATIESDGTLTITYTGSGVGAWGASTAISTATQLLTDSIMYEFNTPEDSVMDRASVFLGPNGRIDMTILPLGGTPKQGGTLTPLAE